MRRALKTLLAVALLPISAYVVFVRPEPKDMGGLDTDAAWNDIVHANSECVSCNAGVTAPHQWVRV